MSASRQFPCVISWCQHIDIRKRKTRVCVWWWYGWGYEACLDWRKKEGGLSHLVLLCTRPLAPALSVSSVDPWTCHLDSPTNHIKVSSPGIHQAKWILDPGAADRPDGEKSPVQPNSFVVKHDPSIPFTPSLLLFPSSLMGSGSDEE